MSYKMDSGQMKIAEKLVILNDRAVGMLTRLYNIKKACAEPKSKPQFLSEKSFDSVIKHIVRKFPVVDVRSNQSTFAIVNTMKDDVLKSLSLYYHTFADLMDLKDHIMQLLTSMDAAQCRLDITLNYELTSGYLNLVVNLISLMILLSRVDDRKVVLGLYTAAYELSQGAGADRHQTRCEPSFPRLGQMILDYENPLKKLSEDLGPLNRLMHCALSSLSSVYFRRNIIADMWRQAQVLSLTAVPHQMHYVAQTDTIACEYLSLDVMDRWIVLCGTVCHNHLLSDTVLKKMWQLALQTTLALRLFRDEIFVIHSSVQHFFDAFKGNSKRSQEVKDAYSVALTESAHIHADRRRFLCGALKEMVLLMKDQPGLLGPKILFVWMALSFSRDEVLWLLRHIDVWPSAKKGGKAADELADRQLPELLHYMLELRDLVRKFSHIIERYHLQYVTGYDAIVTGELVGQLVGLSEDESQMISSFAHHIAHVNSDTNLRALRLDWFRFQACVSVSRSPFSLSENVRLAAVVNTAVFHLKMIDVVDEILRETSDLSIYCFYQRHMESQWRSCLSFPSQARYSISFARICSHFPSALHEMCPEEKTYVIEKALALCNQILDEICATVGEVVTKLCEYEIRLSEQTSATQVAAQVVNELLRAKGGKSAPPPRDVVQAGQESFRRDRQLLTLPDKYQTTLVETCSAIGVCREIAVYDHIFCPREYLASYLENKFVQLIIDTCTELVGQIRTPRRPSDMQMLISSFLTVLHNMDTIVNLDMCRIFNTALLQQTQPLDGRGKETVTAIYTKWYLEVVLRRASTGQMLWSEHLQAMVPAGDTVPFAPEQYTDPMELACLAQILGPYGVKHLSERLIWHVASQVMELFKIVRDHREALQVARTNFDCAERMKEVMMLLQTEPKDKKNPNATCTSDAVLQRTSIIGQIFSFRDALHNALRSVLERRLPFLVASYRNLYESVGDDVKAFLGEMGAAMGEKCLVDTALATSIRAQMSSTPADELHQLSCLLMVAIAVSLPRLAHNNLSVYKPTIQAALNNTHCIPLAVSTLASSLFHLHDKGDTQARVKEFLALATSSVLRVSHDQETHSQETSSNRHYLHVLLDQIAVKSRWLSDDVLEVCFPFALIRSAYLQCHAAEHYYLST